MTARAPRGCRRRRKLALARVNGFTQTEGGEPRHRSAFRLTRLVASLALLALGGAASAGRGPAPLPPQVSEDLSGRWLLVEVASTRSKVVALGEVRSELQAALLLDLEHQDGRLKGAGEVCTFRIESPTSLVRIEFTDAFRGALEQPTLDARIEERGGILHFEQPQVTAVVGAALTKPRGDPLPARPDDPRVVDSDGDGKPGVTVLVRGLIDGELYLVQRTWTSMVGRAVSAQRFEGALSHGKEEVVLGATHDILAAFPPTRPDLARSWFVLERLPASATCAEASARMEDLLLSR